MVRSSRWPAELPAKGEQRELPSRDNWDAISQREHRLCRTRPNRRIREATLMLPMLHFLYSFTSRASGTFKVQLGAYKLADPSPNMIISDVEEIISHPDYAGYDGSMGDIALMKLKSPVNFTDYILPICLPDASVNFFPGERCWITGWGQILQGESLQAPQTLQELEVPIISRDECNNLYNTTDEMNPIKADMICAGYPEGGKDACQGDSGGPLACKRDAVWTLAGVVSWGDGCAKPNHPGVYTLVPFYADWIQDTMAFEASGTLSSLVRFIWVLLLPLQIV
uniref:Peptidase S1 domain-containing protein n=1 Tax=Varanus komodoensis TaxID=61221 RepID=A0A8D2J1V4_VARKO